MSVTTEVLTTPNWPFSLDNGGRVGFAERLNIIQPADFDDEPTIPRGLCQREGLELVVEEEVSELNIPAWMKAVLTYLD